ncbi:protein unc-13 homolog isoform X3 [Coffea arabica]|uniref:Protein unc-13 homolog isoform X3 n=1 Tax=Coffea arabica TaxID=13443 RepID=A0ABM4VD93_COFAR
MEAYSLLERYRLDRRKLLEFILSSGLVREIRTPSGSSASISDVNLDFISADYVLQSIKSGGVLDVALATKKYYEESELPIMMDLHSRDFYFLLTDPQSSGSPPRRPPPPVLANYFDNGRSSTSSLRDRSACHRVSVSGVESGVNHANVANTVSEPVLMVDVPDLGLPSLRTGLLDDDLRESAYEACLACMMFSGIDISIQSRKKDKNPKFLSGLKTKKGKYLQSQSPERHVEFLDTIRMQMQISEVMDTFARRRLVQFASVKAWGQFSVPEIALGFLNGTFRSDFPSVKSYTHWKNRQADILEGYFCFANDVADKQKIGQLVAKIRNSEEWDNNMSPSERSEILLALKQYLCVLSSKPGRFGIQGETYYWTSAYHMNIRLYMKLLFGLFDILEDGQLIEEADELLKIVKLTWPLLGITQKLHSALYVWVLFKQKSSLFKGVMNMAVKICRVDASKHFKFIESDDLGESTSRKVKGYVDRSLEAACMRVMDNIYFGSEVDRTHPLALLASELKIIAERELSMYYPVLCHWYPQAGIAASIRLHRFYGEKLRPFLQSVSCLSEDVRAVLPAANELENCLTELYCTACQENGLTLQFSEEFIHYQIGEISRPLILDWIIAQNKRVMEWTARAFDLENWEPLSHQQKQAPSAVEVFRIIEETLDQLFQLRLPMDITHLQALLSIIFHTLDAYLQKVTSELVGKQNLYPPIPPLTYYKETTFPIVKKKLVESTVLEDEVTNKLNELTTSKLCVRLNTLQYIQKQISALEDGIRKSWSFAGPFDNGEHSIEESPETSGRILDTCSESVDELFVATFDCIRDTAAHAIRSICEFIGVRVVFWDLRKSFLYRLYHGGVENSRLDSLLPNLDGALNQVCGLIDDALRDRVVSSIFRATLEGYVWVLLDGGPSCAFSDLDIPLMEDDLNMLKDLFVADGEGLPRSLVEEEAKFAHQLLSLFSLQAESVIQLLMSSSQHISVGLEVHKSGHRCLGDADSLIRVLCHKKDREASKFLKEQYKLPASSEYDEDGVEPNFKSVLVTDLIRRSASARWSDKGHSSFKSIKKKLQEATWR